MLTALTCATTGSSPLARGLLAAAATSVLAGGIIPARAGFTREGLQEGVAREDHPRSRGVYVIVVGARAGMAGSSPLARGLLSPG